MMPSFIDSGVDQWMELSILWPSYNIRFHAEQYNKSANVEEIFTETNIC